MTRKFQKSFLIPATHHEIDILLPFYNVLTEMAFMKSFNAITMLTMLTKLDMNHPISCEAAMNGTPSF